MKNLFYTSPKYLQNLKGINSSASEIDGVSLGERKIPSQLNVALCPNLRIWRNRNYGVFNTNIKAKKLFEDVFADKIVYVDIATGSDTTGNGTIGNPYRSIYKGVREKPFSPSSGGNLTVYVKAGVYNDADGFNSTGTYASKINIIGYGGLVYANHSSSSTYGYTAFETIQHYIENIVFSGGKSPVNCFNQNNPNNNTLMMFKNCGFNNSLVENGINIRRNGLYIFENCVSKNNFLDGFNYHNFDAIKNQLVIEINCKATGNGTGGGAMDNGSTMHDSGNIIRINGEYYSNSDRNIHDINNSKSWLLGCTSRDGIDITQGNFVVGVDVVDTSIMWLDSCKSSGSNKALDKYNNAPSSLYIFNFEDTCLVESTVSTSPYDYRTV